MKSISRLALFLQSCICISLLTLSFTLAEGQIPIQKTERLDATLEMLRERLAIPGMAVAVSQNGKTIYSRAFGYADLKAQAPATENTQFRLASVSKLLTNMAIVKLCQEGKIALEDPVEVYLSDYPHAGRGVTIERLCRHLGGIRHYNRSDFFNDFKHFDNTDEALEIFIDDPLVNEPGSQYQYSSFSYTLLQAVIEAASGKDFLTYLDEDIFTPLGMEQSVPDQVDNKSANRSELYKVNKKGKATNGHSDDPSYKWGGGGMLSTVGDMIAFGEAHLQGDFLNEEMRKRMFTAAVIMPGSDDKTSIGLTWRIGKDNHGQTIYHHAGSMNGARSFLLLCPEEDLVITILSNANVLDWIHHLAFSIKDALLQPLPSTAERFNAAELQVLDPDTQTTLGTLSFKGDFPIYQCTLNLPDLIEDPMTLNLCTTTDDKLLQLRNVKVASPVLYLELNWNEADGTKQMLLVYRNEEDKMVNQTLLLKVK